MASAARRIHIDNTPGSVCDQTRRPDRRPTGDRDGNRPRVPGGVGNVYEWTY